MINLALHRCVIHLLLIADLLFTSRIYRAIETIPTQPLLLGSATLLIAVYLVMALWRGFGWAPFLLILLLALLLCQMVVFSSIADVPVNWNAGFQFCWLFTFIIFFLAIEDGHGEYLGKTLFLYASIYIFVYVVMSLLLRLGLLPVTAFPGMVLDDAERGHRLFNYGIASAYAWFGWTQRFRIMRSTKSLVMLGVSGLAIYFSFSRVISIAIILLTLIYLSGVNLRSIGRFAFLLFALVSAVIIFGVFDTDWNPFIYFSRDSSGSFRLQEYELARALLRLHPSLGIGIPPNAEEAWDLIQQDYFAASDLGLMGVWFDWGLAGVLLFVAGSYVSCSPRVICASEWNAPLVLTGCLMAVYGCIAPVIFYPAGVTYFAVLAGFFLANCRMPINPTCIRHFA